MIENRAEIRDVERMRVHGKTVPVLTSKRLVLRPFEITDAARLARTTSDALVTHNLLRTTMPFTAHDARRLILRLRKNNLPVWAIDDGQVVGLIGLAGEFGLWLGRSAWGRGYGEEAGRLVIDYAFTQLGMKTLQANPIADNRASQRLLKKLGFKPVGRDMELCKQRSRFVSLRRFLLSKPNR